MTSIPTLLALTLATASAATEARLEPWTVAPGSPARLTITTDTGAVPDIASIPGAQIYSGGQSSRMQIVNGVVSQTATFTYQVVPTAAGRLALGPFRVGPDSTAALSLTVDPSAPSQAPSTRGMPSPRAPAAPQARSAAAVDPGKRAYARLWLGDDTPVVGQATPLTVSAYLRDGVGGTLEQPTLDAADFVVDGLDEEPTQSTVDVDGVPYTRFTWTGRLTPVRAGENDLAATLPATLEWVERSPSRRRRSLLEQMLGDDPFLRGSGLGGFLGSSMLGEPQVKSAHVELDAVRKVTVDTLPADGRPEGFSGIVGTLKARLGPVPETGRVGEPLELSWILEGTGNLDAMRDPGLPDGEGYDVYPPERDLDPTVRSRTQGKVTFRQLVVPRVAGALSLPPLDLSWFDPEQGTYQTASLVLPAVQVSGGPVSNGSVAGAAAAGSTATGPAPSEGGEHGGPAGTERARLLPATAVHGVRGLIPLGWALVVLGWVARRRSLPLARTWSARLRRRWTLFRLRRRLKRAQKTSDVEAFFRAGLALVEKEQPAGEGVRAFVEQADRTLYGRMVPDPDILEALADHLLDDLNEKEAA